MRCRTAVASSIWDRLHEDPLAVGQRRYCRRCPTRYKMSFGVAAELIFKGGKCDMGLYARMQFPPQDMQDLKF
eukprot:10443332-Lingulodinium_polyedra.AAC.1